MGEIITIGATLSAVITIITAVISVYKIVRKIDKKLEHFENNLQENTLSTLRLVIINEKMPINERLNAGKKYVELGGNGEIHATYEALKEKYKEKVR